MSEIDFWRSLFCELKGKGMTAMAAQVDILARVICFRRGRKCSVDRQLLLV